MTKAVSNTLQIETNNLPYAALPRGWQPKSLGDVIKIRNGYAFKSSDFRDSGTLLIRQSNLSSNGISTDKAVHLPRHFIDRYANYRIEKGDVLIGMSGSIGKLCIYNLNEQALQNQRTGLIVFRIPQIREYITHYLRYIEGNLLSLAKGEAVKNISAHQIESFPVPMPPTNQAERIAHRLTRLTAELMRTTAKLESARINITHYHNALLQKLMYDSDASSVPLGRVAQITSGWRIPTDHFTGSNADIPCFKVADLAQIDGQDNAHMNKAQGYISSNDYRKLGLKPLAQGSIVFAKNGGAISLNRRAILSRPSLIDNNMMGIIGSPDVLDNMYLYYFTIGLRLQRFSRSTTIPSIRKSDIAAIPIPLPSISQQKQTVTEIEKQFMQTARMERAINNATRQAEMLGRSILKRAFEGNLLGNEAGYS
ncbi:restriction endonuclease subunit S [Chloroflexota bacterium]